LTLRRSFRAFRLANDLPKSSRTRLLGASTFGNFQRNSTRHATDNRADWSRDTTNRRSCNGTSRLFWDWWNFDVLGRLRSSFILLI
jgi:hypothetical protein